MTLSCCSSPRLFFTHVGRRERLYRLSNWKEGYFPKVAAKAGGNWLGAWLTLAGW